MNFFKKILIALLLLSFQQMVYAQGLSDLLKGIGGNGGAGNVLSSVIEGVFTKSNLTVEDLVGSYTTQGPAVTFKSDNLLQKAGGIAGATAIESKLKPFYEKYGLNNMTLTVDKDANFVMKIKSLKLNGAITKNESEGTFNFNFKVVGMNLGKFTAYIEKSGSTLKLMFDASKLMDLISVVAKFTGNSVATTLSSLLDSYDGACLGFKMVSTGTSAALTNSSNGTSIGSSSSSNILNGLDALKGILNKNK